MKEEKDIIKELIQESISKTPEDFTEQLMRKINESSLSVRLSWLHRFALGLSVIIICGLLYILNGQTPKILSVENIYFHLPPMSFQIVLIVFVLLAVYKYLSLKKEAENFCCHSSKNSQA